MSNYQEIKQLAENLVEIPSKTTDQEAVLQALDLVSEYLADTGIEVKTIHGEHDGKRAVSRLWGHNGSLLTPKLLLSGHIDVVDEDPELGSNHFVAQTDTQGIMTGRGTYDMKGPLVSMITAYKQYLMEGGRGVSLLLTGDEEIGGFAGARYVVDHESLRPEVVFIPDGPANFAIVDSQKAPHHFFIRATGPGGHASRAFEIDNPLDRVWKVYQAMRQKYAESSSANIDDPTWISTFEMTVVETHNTSANKIPSLVEAQFSWRWPLERFAFEEGMDDMRRICHEFGCEIDTSRSHGMGEGCLTQVDAPFVSTWRGVVENIIGRPINVEHMHGATDGRHFYQPGCGAKVLVTNAVGGGEHGKNEWVDLNSLVQLSEAIYKYQKLLITNQ